MLKYRVTLRGSLLKLKLNLIHLERVF